MRLTKLLPAAALVIGLLSTAAQAIPYSQVTVAPLRAYVLTADSAGSGFDRVEISLWQTQAGVNAGQTSGAVTGPEWHACVFSWLKRSFFSDCGTPTAVAVGVPRTGASGTIGFDLRDAFWGDTARVRLSLVQESGLPLPAYTVNPYVTGTYQHGVLTTGLTRNARVAGTIALTTHQGRLEQMTRKLPAGARMTVSDLLSGEATASV